MRSLANRQKGQWSKTGTESGVLCEPVSEEEPSAIQRGPLVVQISISSSVLARAALSARDTVGANAANSANNKAKRSAPCRNKGLVKRNIRLENIRCTRCLLLRRLAGQSGRSGFGGGHAVPIANRAQVFPTSIASPWAKEPATVRANAVPAIKVLIFIRLSSR